MLGTFAVLSLGLNFFPKRDYVETIDAVSFKMVYIKGITFMMGSNVLGDQYEQPEHPVTLSDFYIAETEVTQALYTAVMGKNPSMFKGDERPVENVSWDDAQVFVKKLNELTGKKYSLPTEAQWEYAARANENYKYAGSDSVAKVAWYHAISDKMTHPVKTKAPNGFGLYDMTGNVLEWCEDYYSETFYQESDGAKDPVCKTKAEYRVLRGGSWNNSAEDCLTIDRFGNFQNIEFDVNGIRLVHSVE